MEDEIQVGIAEEMELFYSATLRFDFPAHGTNTSDELTLRACRETLLAVAEEAKRRFPDVEDLCVFASGFGAYVTLTTLEDLVELPGSLKLVVQTPGLLMHETLLKMIHTSRETLWAMETVMTRRSRPIAVTYSFYEELLDNLVLTSHPIPMLILQGETDSVIRPEHFQNFARLNEGSKMVTIPGTSHEFMEEGAWDMVLDLTRDWFEFEQVLLMDCE
jgi:pimeloyl-ACP methyl ester carboxylesterase